jgi:hypothetical protein
MKKIVFAMVAGAAAAATSVQAAIDTTSVTSALTDAGTAAGVVGLAALGVHAGIKAFHMIRRAM